MWNVRGAGKKLFPKTVSDMRMMHNFDVLAVLEPRISGIKATRVIQRLGFSDNFVVEADGFSGGIWLLWNSNKVKLQVIANSKQTITAIVADNSNYWVFTVVYASPSVAIRRNLWRYLDAIRGCYNGPWIILGDFNEIINNSEKRGGRFSFTKSGFA